MANGSSRLKKRSQGTLGDELEYEGLAPSAASTGSAGMLASEPSREIGGSVPLPSSPPLEETAILPPQSSSASVDDAAVPTSISAAPVEAMASSLDAAEVSPEPSLGDSTGPGASIEQEAVEVDIVVRHANSLESGTVERIKSLAIYSDEQEAVYAPRKIPSGLEWSSTNLKDSKLTLGGKSTPVSLCIIGRVTWNGMIPKPSSTSSPGVAYIAVDPLIEGDLAKLRDLMARYSSSGVSVDGMTSVRASRVMSYRKRNNPDMQVETFGCVYDARDGKADVGDMAPLNPSFVMQHDVVLIKVSLGRFRDTKSKDWSKYRLSLELDAVYVLAQAPKDSFKDRSPAKKMRRVI
ncbi:hypothetical protein K488DRAFT_74874 [Vararia minispora EC-137]|uniref:Uncharacterized protein n=1 Tax=Vararia minispora EC-137 TaxID=1314806 RepID=A0ACB8Q5H3_9AGAM|nr:hypothetical protein K488DRAFT_74874 [Vararia minispora EC-137]